MQSNSKKKILIFSNYDWTLYKFRKNLINQLSKNYEVILLTKKTKNVYLENFNNKIIYINFDIYNFSPLKNFLLFIKVFKIYKNLKPHCCLHFTNKPNIIGGIASRYLKINYINNIAWGGSETLKFFSKKFLFIMHKISLKKVKKVFFQNNDDLKLFKINKIISNKNYEVLPGSGVDLDFFSKFKKIKNNESNKTRFIMVSRLIKNKGILEFLESTKLISEKYKNTEFFLIGEMLKSDLFISKKDLANYSHINYLGYKDSVYQFLSQSDCIILPSYREGVPRTLIEAAAIGLPIITTDVPGCREVCYDNINGFLCKEKDVLDLFKKIELFILSSKEQKLLFSQNSLKISQKFDEKYVIDRYINVIENL